MVVWIPGQRNSAGAAWPLPEGVGTCRCTARARRVLKKSREGKNKKPVVPVVQAGKVDIWPKWRAVKELRLCPVFQIRAVQMRSFGNSAGNRVKWPLLSHDSHRRPKKRCVKPAICVERRVIDALNRGLRKPEDSQLGLLG